MKKIFYILSILAGIGGLWGCENPPQGVDRDISIETYNGTENVAITTEGADAAVRIGYQGGRFQIRVNSSLRWAVQLADIKIDDEGGETAEGVVTWDPSVAGTKWFEVARSDFDDAVLNVTVGTFYYDPDTTPSEEGEETEPLTRRGDVWLTIGNDPRAKVKITQSGWERAYVDIGVTGEIKIPSIGGDLEYELNTNQDVYNAYAFATEGAGPWLDVDVVSRPGKLLLSAGRNTTGRDLRARLVLKAGVGENEKSDTINVSQSDGFMKLKYKVEESMEAVLPLCGEVNLTVDWGDGSAVQTHELTIDPEDDASFIRHTYSGAGNYVVAVGGQAERMRSAGLADEARAIITGVQQWGNIGLRSLEEAFAGTAVVEMADMQDKTFVGVTNLNRMFHDCDSLVTVNGSVFTDCRSVTAFDEVFAGCDKLSSVPSELFARCDAAISFERTFADCATLSSIPAGLFAANRRVTSFTGTFEDCGLLKAIPAGLFKENIAATSFNRTFKGCESLKSLPGDLFVNNTRVTSLWGTFSGCVSLETVPVAIFDTNTRVTDFTDIFNGCVEYKGSTSPYTRNATEDVYLYRRSQYPREFNQPANYRGAFAGCTLLKDYQQMQDNYPDWVRPSE